MKNNNPYPIPVEWLYSVIVQEPGSAPHHRGRARWQSRSVADGPSTAAQPPVGHAPGLDDVPIAPQREETAWIRNCMVVVFEDVKGTNYP